MCLSTASVAILWYRFFRIYLLNLVNNTLKIHSLQEDWNISADESVFSTGNKIPNLNVSHAYWNPSPGNMGDRKWFMLRFKR